MALPERKALLRSIVHALIMATGFAALSWEVVWQIRSSLALGVSAMGTALTIAITMGGMSLGAFVMGHALRRSRPVRPARVYGALEIVIGCAGLCLVPAFRTIEKLDTWVYDQVSAGGTMLAHVLGITAVLGVPALCMGATVPILGLLARRFDTSIGLLYGLNTLGAAAGTVLVAFLLIPLFGLAHATLIIAAVNIAVGFVAWNLDGGESVETSDAEAGQIAQPSPGYSLTPVMEALIVFVTGFATFALEIVWFRALTAVFLSTTSAFAVMLASVLLALGQAARWVPYFKKRARLGTLMGCAAMLIFLATPLVEQLNGLLASQERPVEVAPQRVTEAFRIVLYINLIVSWFGLTLLTIGPPIFLLGMALPWILDEQRTPRRWGRLYGLNTLGAIVGSIGTAWVLLPVIGFSWTAWLAGALVLLTGIMIVPYRLRVPWAVLGVAVLAVSMALETGEGRTKPYSLAYQSSKPTKVLEYYEGPEATVSVIEHDNGAKKLYIDGTLAAEQSGSEEQDYEHYMRWMGRLPMLAHPDPKDALVICFGTGQTANAVRNENPRRLDIVDVNPRIFKLAHNFDANQGVLNDARVRAIAMDGRAFLRRTRGSYDVITLEPMPPTFAGVNALYSKEFYELARERLTSNGTIAQWLPFHVVAPVHAASIARTFQEIFPNAILWMDPISKIGILLGSKDPDASLETGWHGFEARPMERDLSVDEVKNAVLLDRLALARYVAPGRVITDDNQLLAYGKAVSLSYGGLLEQENFSILDRMVEDERRREGRE